MGNAVARRAAQPAPQKGRQGTTDRIEEIRGAMLGKADEITQVMAGQIEPEKFVQIALTMIATIADWQHREKVLACTTESLVLCVLQAAQTGLRLDGKQATVIPYGQTAQFTPMVKGRIDLILRAQNVAKVVARHVYDCDEFDYMLGTEEWIRHRPALDRPDDARLTHAYAVVTYRDGTQAFEVLDGKRVMTIRSKMAKQPDSPAWKYSEPQMWEKCALNRVSRLVDVDPDHAARMAIAEAAEFRLPADDADVRVADRISTQLADARDRVAKLQAGEPQAGEPVAPARQPEPSMPEGPDSGTQEPSPEPPKRQARQPKASSPAVVAQKQAKIGLIRDACRRQHIEGEVAVREIKTALALAGLNEYPVNDQGAPDLSAIPDAALAYVLEHLRQLGPGFPPKSEPGPEPGAAEPESENAAGPLLVPRKIADMGPVHIIDPLRPDRPPKCVGCGIKIGAHDGATSVPEPPTDPTAYCAKALNEIDRSYEIARIPGAVQEALLGLAEGL